MKISFDFDCTLGEEIIQKLSDIIISSNKYSDVYIITSRVKDTVNNMDLYLVAKNLGIPDSNIYFTEGQFKWEMINKLNIDIHFDDVPEECELIMAYTKCIPMLIWDKYCAGTIKHNSFGRGLI